MHRALASFQISFRSDNFDEPKRTFRFYKNRKFRVEIFDKIKIEKFCLCEERLVPRKSVYFDSRLNSQNFQNLHF